MFRDVLDALRNEVPGAFGRENAEAGRFPWNDFAPDDRERIEIWSPEWPEEPAGVPEVPRLGLPPLVWDGGEEPELPRPAIQGEVERSGIEALAYYRSYHMADRWGVYVREAGLYLVASDVFDDSNSDAVYRVQIAFRLLHAHEILHFLTDTAATLLELTTACPLYLPYVRGYASRNWNPLEEGLANAYALRNFAGKTWAPRIRSFMDGQPHGYKDFRNWGRPSSFLLGRRNLATEILNRHLGSLPLGEMLFDFRMIDLDMRDVPVYLVLSPASQLRGGRWRFISSVRNINLSQRFQKELAALGGEVVKQWRKAERLLAQDTRSRSLKFEKLKNCDRVFSVRLSQSYRATLRLVKDDHWLALRVGNHDDIYRNPGWP